MVLAEKSIVFTLLPSLQGEPGVPGRLGMPGPPGRAVPGPKVTSALQLLVLSNTV